ncbi:MAG: B12-binding domain-containing radical SAM protein [Actinobacteria bacterium]|nr:B12-binding domain-containing radical SAM protein [Actinomycetota bacterium]
MRVALVAMSGIRTYNPELKRIGLTLPGFAERGRVIASLPSLSLLTLAALTPEPHEISYHEVADLEELEELPACDVAALSTYTAQVKDAYALADRYRREGVRTVLGGLHATARPDEALDHFDAVVAGEGEVLWQKLLADLDAGRPEGVYDARGAEYDLASAPIPRFDLLDPDRYNRLTVQTQRGCPWRCEFCGSSILLTSRYKRKPVEKVVAEVRAIKEIWARPFIEFADDNTFVDKAHSRELMRALAPEEVRWFTETDVSVADDPELLALMHEAGCAEVLIGFESPRVEGLEGLELRRNWKRTRLGRYATAVERIQSQGIAVNACFVLGLDGDGPEIFDAVEAFVEETGPFDVQITVMTPLPGTPLYGRLLREGRLLEEGAWERCTLFDVNFRPLQMPVEELERGLVDLGLRLYGEGATRRRRRAFVGQWREGRRAAGPESAASEGP